MSDIFVYGITRIDLLRSVSQLVRDSEIYRAEGGGLFSPNPGLVIWTWIVFFALLLILYRFAWKPILKSLDDREKKINDSIGNAARIQEEVEEISKKNEELLVQARLEGQKIIEDCRRQADRLKEKVKKQAETEAHELVEKARLSINEAKREAVQSIKQEAIHLSIEIASKLIDENLDDEKNKKLANNFLSSIK